MVSTTWKAMLVAVASLGAMTLVAAEQIRREVPAIESFAIFPTQDPERIRLMAITQLGLNSSKLKLATAQKAQIDKIIDAYAADQIALNKKYPIEQGKRIAPTDLQRREALVGSLTSALAKVMSSDQRSTWEADRLARRSALEHSMARSASRTSNQ